MHITTIREVRVGTVMMETQNEEDMEAEAQTCHHKGLMAMNQEVWADRIENMIEEQEAWEVPTQEVMGLTKITTEMKDGTPRDAETTMKMIDMHQNLIMMKVQGVEMILIERTETGMDLLEGEEMIMDQGAWTGTMGMNSLTLCTMMTGVHLDEVQEMNTLTGCTMMIGVHHQEAQGVTMIQCMTVGGVHLQEAQEMITTEAPVELIDNLGGKHSVMLQDPIGKQGMAMLERALSIPQVDASGTMNHHFDNSKVNE